MALQEVKDYTETLIRTQAAQPAIFDFGEAESLTKIAIREKVSTKQHLADILARSAAIRGIKREYDGTEYRINSVLREELTSAVRTLMFFADQKDVFSVKADANGDGTLYLIGINMVEKPKKIRSVELLMDNGDSKSFYVQTKGGYHYFRTLAPYMS